MSLRRRRQSPAGFQPWQYGAGGLLANNPAPADLWEKTLWPNYPKTDLVPSITTATVLAVNFPTNATIADVTGPDGEQGVRISIVTGSSAITMPITSDIDVTKSNIEILFRMVANSAELTSGKTTITAQMYSASTPAAPGANHTDCRIEGKLRIHHSGATNVYVMSLPVNQFNITVGTGADKAHFKFLRLLFTRSSGGLPVFDVLGWRIRPNPRYDLQTPVIFRFDGGEANTEGSPDGQYNIALPKLKTAFGNTSCKAFVTFAKRVINAVGFCTDAQLANWINAGAMYAPHGGYTTDSNQADEAAYYNELSQHRIWAKAYGIANGFPNIDHWSSFFTWYSSVSSQETAAQRALIDYRIATWGMQFSAGTVGAAPLSLGGGAYPPSRWTMECLSGNSFDSVANWPADSDVIASTQAAMDNARANRGQITFGWHAMTAGDRASLVLDTAIAKVLAEPSNFVAVTPYELFDADLATYGGIQ